MTTSVGVELDEAVDLTAEVACDACDTNPAVWTQINLCPVKHRPAHYCDTCRAKVEAWLRRRAALAWLLGVQCTICSDHQPLPEPYVTWERL